ncbi:uncharacterized protein ACWYII_047075 [Salvelinus alpinus]
MEASINIGVVDDLKARFGGLLKDEGVQNPVESFRVLNPDTWPEDQASLLPFGDDGVADLTRLFKEPLERLGCNIAAIHYECQGLKILVSHNFNDKSYSGLWETMTCGTPTGKITSWCSLWWRCPFQPPSVSEASLRSTGLRIPQEAALGSLPPKT